MNHEELLQSRSDVTEMRACKLTPERRAKTRADIEADIAAFFAAGNKAKEIPTGLCEYTPPRVWSLTN